MSMTFWVVFVLIIVILAIIGYIYEGKILSEKSKENVLEENHLVKKTKDTWDNNISTETVDKNEKNYNIASEDWLSMPTVNSKIETVSDNKEINFSDVEKTKINDLAKSEISSYQPQETISSNDFLANLQQSLKSDNSLNHQQEPVISEMFTNSTLQQSQLQNDNGEKNNVWKN